MSGENGRRDGAANKGIARNTAIYHPRLGETTQPSPDDVFGGARYQNTSQNTTHQESLGSPSERHPFVVRPPPFAGHDPGSSDSFYRRHERDASFVSETYETRIGTRLACEGQQMKPHQPSRVGDESLNWQEAHREPTGHASVEKLCATLRSCGASASVALCRSLRTEATGEAGMGLTIDGFSTAVKSVLATVPGGVPSVLDQGEIQALFYRFGGLRPGNAMQVSVSECVQGILLRHLAPPSNASSSAGGTELHLAMAAGVFKAVLERVKRQEGRQSAASVTLRDLVESSPALMGGGGQGLKGVGDKENERAAMEAIRNEAVDAFRSSVDPWSSPVTLEEFLVFSHHIAESLNMPGQQQQGMFGRALCQAFGVCVLPLEFPSARPAGKENAVACSPSGAPRDDDSVLRKRNPDDNDSSSGTCNPEVNVSQRVHRYHPSGAAFALQVPVPPTPFEVRLAQETASRRSGLPSPSNTPSRSVGAAAAGLSSQAFREPTLLAPPRPPSLVTETQSLSSSSSSSEKGPACLPPSVKVLEGQSGVGSERDSFLAASFEEAQKREELRLAAYLENRSRPWLQGGSTPISSPISGFSSSSALPTPPPPPPFTGAQQQQQLQATHLSMAASRQASHEAKTAAARKAATKEAAASKAIDDAIDAREARIQDEKMSQTKQWAQAAASEAQHKRAADRAAQVEKHRQERELLYGPASADSADSTAAAASKNSNGVEGFETGGSVGDSIVSQVAGLASLRHFPANDGMEELRREANHEWAKTARAVWEAQAKSRETAPLSISRKPEFGGTGIATGHHCHSNPTAAGAPSSADGTTSSPSRRSNPALGGFGEGEVAVGGGEYRWVKSMREASDAAESARRQGDAEALAEYEAQKKSQEVEAARAAAVARGRPLVHERRFRDTVNGRALHTNLAAAAAADDDDNAQHRGGDCSLLGGDKGGAGEGVVDEAHDYPVSVYSLTLQDVKAIALGKGRSDLVQHLDSPDKIDEAKLARLLQWETHRPGDELRTKFGVSTKRQANFLAQLLTLLHDSCSGNAWMDACVLAHHMKPGNNPVERVAFISERRAKEAEAEKPWTGGSLRQQDTWQGPGSQDQAQQQQQQGRNERASPEQQESTEKHLSAWHAMGYGERRQLNLQQGRQHGFPSADQSIAGLGSSAPDARWSRRGAKYPAAEVPEWAPRYT